MTTESQESSSDFTQIVGRLASIAALLSLLFLPVAGCNGMEGLSGVDILSEENLNGSYRAYVGFVVALSILGAFSLGAKPRAVAGIIAGATLLIGYGDVRADSEGVVQLRAGSYVALTCFAVQIALALLRRPSHADWPGDIPATQDPQVGSADEQGAALESVRPPRDVVVGSAAGRSPAHVESGAEEHVKT